MKIKLVILLFLFTLQSCDNKTVENNGTVSIFDNSKEVTIQSDTDTNGIYQLRNENILFSFQTKKNKILTICIDKDQKYIVYRYGTDKKVELEYPKKKDKSSFAQFEYSGWERGGGVQNEGIQLDYLSFTESNFKYVVYNTYYAVGDRYRTGIKIINTENSKVVDVEGIYQTINGTLRDFRFDERIKKGDELYD